MFHKKKLSSVLLPLLAVFALLIGTFVFFPAGSVYAETIKCADGTVKNVGESDSGNLDGLCAANGGVKPGETAESEAITVDCTEADVDASNCGIVRYLLDFINGLSAIVGIVIVMMITIGGIQYSAAGDNPQATMAAKKRIGNAIGALLLYIFMFAFLQWIVPGGVF